MTVRLHHNEIRNRSHAFVQKWRAESREEAEAKSFWDAFFSVFGIERKDVAVFEWSVAKLDARHGFIDLFWKGVLLVEHKSRGKSLDKAESQAFEYYLGLPEKEKPNFVLLSDFATFRLYDLRRKQEYSFAIEALPEHIHLFDFMSGLQHYGDVAAETTLNIQAAELLGSLHDALADSGYSGHELEIFLVRILFCLFAEDTGIFPHHLFINYLLNFTVEDGSDTEMHLSKLFQVMDTPFNKRSKNLTAELNEFPYVNGHLFRERLDMPSFDAAMRDVLLDGAHFDWSSISPAIFGSLFQSIMDKDARRNLGAHYTSETHILRLIKPLFLDALWAEFRAIQQGGNRDKRKKLAAFQQRLTALQFFDPACGCGNFLIITYRELRRLELAVLRAQHGDKLDTTHLGLDITVEPTIKLEHFHGIEIEEWPARIAEVAMWLTQHQMNREFARQFGREPDLLPLKTAAHITIGNSLHLDWNSVVARDSLSHIIGNPPFIGKNFRLFGNSRGSHQM
ncbi:class I SAM-dependent DNA methyltransferase [Thiothrix fructosivorans]|uniref:site-specific DNA-methyltransferase (adenine-specific) n=1 Tax=Thiothrix fructosivorans TaxID=111770 RepID=A0A8B0SPV7_9GAMM|nr:class I SAM-dependent DNA methyltransferase [Thiothrix fructosivorans]MBO0614146.1 class I SAM-dependent DNA methyltransferase [Thiothrix fructosivorans]QTX12630.1 class I SAM-dependent DNA methyltransferase [Thiothrix fructosivorans]